jgi:hypothetical protein
MAVMTLTYDPTQTIRGNGVAGQVSAVVQPGSSSWLLGSSNLPGSVQIGQFPNSFNPNTVSANRIQLAWPLRGGLSENATIPPTRPLGTVAFSAVGLPINSPGAAQAVPGLRGTTWTLNVNTAGIYGIDQFGGVVTPSGSYNYASAAFVNTPAWASISGFVDGYRNLNGHSKILGWSIDGYPIYGPFGYQDPLSSNSLVVRMRSGYQLAMRSNRPGNVVLRVRGQQRKSNEITLNNPDQAWPGLVLTGSSLDGVVKILSKDQNVITLDQRVNVNNNDVLQGSWPLGIFVEDWQYVENSIQPTLGFVPPYDKPLDRHNGRFCVTPEYPNGTYAYFATVDENLAPAYPYFVGNTLYGDLNVTALPELPGITWTTPEGDLGTVAQGIFYQLPLTAELPGSTVYYQLLSGDVPAGLQVVKTGSITGVPNTGQYTQDFTTKFAVRAYTEITVNGTQVIDQLADRTFTITVSGRGLPRWVTAPGLIAAFYDGTPIAPIQLSYVDPAGNAQIKLAAGQLPPGLELTATGEIQGVIMPAAIIDQPAGFDLTPESVFPYDFLIRSVSKNYQFTCEITDGVDSDLRTFEIFVQSRDALTADNDYITADDTIITADQSNNRVPFLLNPVGSIGIITHDNWFAYKFDAVDLDGQQVEYIITVNDDPGDTWSLPPGLALDPGTGWLYGYIPSQGTNEVTYKLAMRVRQKFDPTVISEYYFYDLTIQAGLDTRIDWLSPTNLGSLVNGSTSILKVQAENLAGVQLNYRLLQGSNSKLPQGLQLLDTGEIAGNASFNCFAIDNGTTTFDVNVRGLAQPTTFDTVFRFTVEAYSPLIRNVSYSVGSITIMDPGIGYVNPQVTISPPQGVDSAPAVISSVDLDTGGIAAINLSNKGKGYRTQPVVTITDNGPGFAAEAVANLEIYESGFLVSSTKRFEITLNRKFNEPLQTIYISALSPEQDRQLVDNLLQDRNIFNKEVVFRPNDPNFGVATSVQYNHIYGLTASTVEAYAQALYLNHYWKQLILGPITSAQAIDSTGQVVYEVIYSEIIDDLVNNAGQSISKSVQWPYPIDVDGEVITTVYPNSLINMRDQILSTIPQDNTVLPLWMTSPQANGRQLGFVPAWVIAYVRPGTSAQVLYNINRTFGEQLNKIDFTVDRYELDRLLSKNWDPIYDSTGGAWVPTPNSTTFDYDKHYRELTTDGSTEIFTPGVDYTIGDEIRVLGSQLGGNDGVNDLLIRIIDVGPIGNIREFVFEGTANFLSVGNQFIGIAGSNIVGVGTGATFDIVISNNTPTVFDGNSLQFNRPVDIYTNTNRYNKYLVFPKRTILG